MTIFTHGVTASAVIEDRLPFASGTITASSEGLSTSTIEGYITRAAGIINTLLERNGIDPENLGSNETELIKEAITAYVLASALERRQWDRDEVQRAWEAWHSLRKTIRESPSDLGKADVQGSIQTNVDTSSDANSWGSHFKGW